MRGDVGKDVKKVGGGVDAFDGNDGQGGGNAVTFTSGVGAIERAGVVPGVVRTVEEVLYHLVGGGDVKLVDIINL